jgi:hypothetical protein
MFESKRYMKTKLFVLLLVLVTLNSCSLNEEEFEETNITNVDNDLKPEKIYRSHFGFEEYEVLYIPDLIYDLFTYNNVNKLVKMEKANFSNTVYWVYLNFEYNGNKVVVENKSDLPNLPVPKKKIIYTLDNSGRIIEKSIPDPIAPYAEKKYYFQYDSQGRLYQIRLIYPNITQESPYFSMIQDLENVETFYYQGANLEKTITQTMRSIYENSNVKVEKVFSDYDAAKNPFKKLEMVDFYFYRSISDNNYRNLKTYAYDENNVKTLYSEQGFQFSYDPNHNLILTF